MKKFALFFLMFFALFQSIFSQKEFVDTILSFSNDTILNNYLIDHKLLAENQLNNFFDNHTLQCKILNTNLFGDSTLETILIIQDNKNYVANFFFILKMFF